MFFTSPDKSIQVVVNRSYGQTKNRVLGENLSKKVEPMSERDSCKASPSLLHKQYEKDNIFRTLPFFKKFFIGHDSSSVFD